MTWIGGYMQHKSYLFFHMPQMTISPITQITPNIAQINRLLYARTTSSIVMQYYLDSTNHGLIYISSHQFVRYIFKTNNHNYYRPDNRQRNKDLLLVVEGSQILFLRKRYIIAICKLCYLN